MKYYAVADVHGFTTCLRQALEQAGFYEDTEPHKLIMCGDLLDRGTEANQLIEFMIELNQRGELIYILGNHEDLLTKAVHQVVRGGIYEVASPMSHHCLNGTWDTLLQISQMTEAEAYYNPNELVRRVINSPFYQILLPSAVDFYETSHYIFTHGWIPCFTEGFKPYVKYQYDPDWHEADVESWRRARWMNGMELACNHHILEPNKTIVSGHFHSSWGHSKIAHKCSEFGDDAVFTPFYSDGIIAIDACTVTSGMVNCIVIED